MTTPEPALTELENSMTPFEYMDWADRELAFDNYRKAAALMWKAAEATFLGLAKQRGINKNDLIRLNAEQKPPVDYSDVIERIYRKWKLDLSLRPGVFINLTKELETDETVRKLSYGGYRVTASLLHAHAVLDVLENYQLEDAYDDARRFVMEFVNDPE